LKRLGDISGRVRIQVEEDTTDTGDEAAGSCACPTCEAIELLARRWTPHVLATIRQHGPIRFNDLERRLGPVSSRTLSTRSSELVDAGLVNRVDHDETPPRVEYELTEHGENLREAVEDLDAWARNADE
jgi:DNA-binding HxlR family transcriptional regulator